MKQLLSKYFQAKHITIGWNEWCSLPALGLPIIKAKIDTGAKISALHAFNIKTFFKDDVEHVIFHINPIQNNHTISKICTAIVVDRRNIMSSNGHREHRIVIKTPLKLENTVWDILITLSNRDPLQFRMLLGREALSERVIIHPDRSCLLGKPSKKILLDCYDS